jgi:hypothetical protein
MIACVDVGCSDEAAKVVYVTSESWGDAYASGELFLEVPDVQPYARLRGHGVVRRAAIRRAV